MFYDASQNPHPADSGFSCLSVATAPSLSATSPVFTDSSGAPLFCDAARRRRPRSEPVRRPGHRCGLPVVEVQRRELVAAAPMCGPLPSMPPGPPSPDHRRCCSPWIRPTCPGRPRSTTPRWSPPPVAISCSSRRGTSSRPRTRRPSPAAAAPSGRAANRRADRSSPPTDRWPARVEGPCSRTPVVSGGWASPVGRPGAPITRAAEPDGSSPHPSI